MNKWKFGFGAAVVLIIAGWISWTFFIPSEDIKKGVKDLRADAVGLDRVITHTLYDGSKKTWSGRIKIFPFPTEGGGGGGFSFLDEDGKKIICGPGWRIEEK
ncbi:hypothetical protein [Desulfoluna spongiiphila]|uniref:Uncharacterized protein n=1 Tax=Desulfoluna spongiiphila TaxID=419481 RepID=A0A1G5HIA0_9BACT|nr:hypothetical protein [Desulfoluna spongiiphila]SCY63209.1 hypothetical protein SAMN05216233_11444 [Desulfoluna spongiiphila]VVS93437.1 hypothetical protein DBB_30090 [Desulfoluna spongiiphila]